MKKVFEPGEVELADPRGDPNRVIDIQKKIKELLEANSQRQAGIIDEIREEGAWALPGLLNATYVWMNHFENNKPAQKIMAKILGELAKENDSAVALLVDSGVLENPFKIPREIALQALEGLNWRPSLVQIAKINTKIQGQKKSEDIEGLILSYQILARSGDKNAYNIMLKQCSDWSISNTGDAAILLNLLVTYYPESAIKILTEVFLSTKSMFKEKKLAEDLITALHPISPDWWLDSTIVTVSINVLKECNPPRHTTIEYFFKNAAQDAKQSLPHFWEENSKKINTLIFETTESLNDSVADQISRYWFRALGNVSNNLDIIIEAADSDIETWGDSAALQLFFMRSEKGKKHKDVVEKALSKLMEENGERYDRVEDMFNEISTKRKHTTEMKTISKNAMPTDRRK